MLDPDIICTKVVDTLLPAAINWLLWRGPERKLNELMEIGWVRKDKAK